MYRYPLEAKMIKRDARLAWIVPVFLALAVLACSGSSPEPTATPLPRSTQKPNASATTAPAKPTSTKAPAKPTATGAEQPTDVPTDSGTVQAPFTLSSQPFKHKSGAFTITLPDGWKVDEADHSVFVSSPDSVASIDVSFTNVGAKFDNATLTTYIKAEEDNWFGTFKNYNAEANKTLKDGITILVHKTFDLSDGTPETVFSYYWQDGNVIYEQDFWADTSVYDQYVDGMVNVANTMKDDSAAGGKADAYGIVYKFTDPNNLYDFKVPYGWTHATSTDTHTNIETFTSPDALSYVENVEYDDGTTLSQTDAEAFANDLLKKYYKLTDLTVLENWTKQKDGSYRLTWTSASKGIDGESFYATHATTFLLLTWVVDTNQYDLFNPVWSTLVNSLVLKP
jgi:hypothetical protein